MSDYLLSNRGGGGGGALTQEIIVYEADPSVSVFTAQKIPLNLGDNSIRLVVAYVKGYPTTIYCLNQGDSKTLRFDYGGYYAQRTVTVESDGVTFSTASGTNGDRGFIPEKITAIPVEFINL